MGGGKGGGTPPPSQYEQQAGRIAGQLFDETDPLRAQLINLYGSLFGLAPQQTFNTVTERVPVPGGGGYYDYGDSATEWSGGGAPQYQTVTRQVPGAISLVPTGQQFDPRTHPAFSTLFEQALTATAGADKASREAILASTPRGGAQSALLAESARTNAQARRMAELGVTADIINQLFSGAQSTAFGTPSQSLQGYGIAGAQAAQRQASGLSSQAITNQGKKQTGTALGLGLMAFGNPLSGLTAGKGATDAGVSSLTGGNYLLSGPTTFPMPF